MRDVGVASLHFMAGHLCLMSDISLDELNLYILSHIIRSPWDWTEREEGLLLSVLANVGDQYSCLTSREHGRVRSRRGRAIYIYLVTGPMAWTSGVRTLIVPRN